MASRSWNKVELIGNLTRDPELRYTPQGTAVATFSIATNRTYVYEGEKREEVDFHRIVAWNKLAELCQQLLKKGNKVFVSGRLQNRSWEGQDGQQRQTTEIVIEDMILLTSKGTGDGGSDYSEEEESVPTRSVEDTPKASAKETSEKEDKKDSKKASKKDDTEEIGDLDDLPF
jgi:single-strand DNA-binding protein